jgi:catechol 2,3-dioxygenase-like lactoylglutathione lyase family enzyme
MLLKHVGLFCSSEEHSDRFYRDILQLERVSSKQVPRDLMKQIFGIDSECLIINYADDEVSLETFIYERPEAGGARVDHVCLQVSDLDDFLRRCRDGGAGVNVIPREGSPLVFVYDFDVNLFEIKS